MIRDVGTRARTEITKLLGRPAHLKLEVKVVPDWTTSPEALARLGYRAVTRATHAPAGDADDARCRCARWSGAPTSASRRCSTAWSAAGRRWSRTCRA